MDSKDWNVKVAKDMIKECEKYLAKIEHNDRFLASDIDDVISICMCHLEDVVNKYAENNIEEADKRARQLEAEYDAPVVWMGGNKFIVVKDGKEIEKYCE